MLSFKQLGGLCDARVMPSSNWQLLSTFPFFFTLLTLRIGIRLFFFLLSLFRCNCSLHTTLFYVYGVSGLVRKVSLRF